MIKLLIGVLTAFSVVTADMMQGYVDRANAIAGSIDPKYANTLSVETRPSVYLQASRQAIEAAKTHAPDFAADVESLYEHYEGRISAAELQAQLDFLEEQAEANPVISAAGQYLEESSVYFEELVLTLALDLALADLRAWTDNTLDQTQKLWFDFFEYRYQD